MKILNIGASAVAGTSITIPGTYQAGDVIILFAFNSGAATAPTTVAGWTSIGSSTLNGAGSRLAWKLATSNSEVSGTWTNATDIACVVYRNQSTATTPVKNVGSNMNNNTSVLWQTVAMSRRGTSWIVSLGAIKSIDTAIETGPSILTNRADNVGATSETVAFDTNGPCSNFPTATSSLGPSVGGTGGPWHVYNMELCAEQGAVGLKTLRPAIFKP